VRRSGERCWQPKAPVCADRWAGALLRRDDVDAAPLALRVGHGGVERPGFDGGEAGLGEELDKLVVVVGPQVRGVRGVVVLVSEDEIDEVEAGVDVAEAVALGIPAPDHSSESSKAPGYWLRAKTASGTPVTIRPPCKRTRCASRT
jgi:hypothetical protein